MIFMITLFIYLGLTYGIAAACICIGDLNIIAPIIAMFFMMTYALINFSCYELSLSKSPGWRPAFKTYSWHTALIGAVLCIVCMFLTGNNPTPNNP